jgi:ectoine hydroxylase-related dioxygenase (phytanoyl-CoA dioxygenase family)
VDLDAAAGHFAEHGWVMVDVLPPDVVARLPRWVDEVAALSETTGVLQHHEATDAGRQLCRSEDFVPVHAGLRELLCRGALLEVAARLLGEPAVLYKEKVNYKLPGGAGYSPHQDAPAYPMIEAHVSAMIAVDDAAADNGGLEVVSGCFDTVLHTDARGCIASEVAATLEWQPIDVRAGCTLWFHSRTPHRSRANRSDRPRRALYPTYNAAREGDRRADYYAEKRTRFARTSPGDRALVSLIGDFEGRPA